MVPIPFVGDGNCLFHSVSLYLYSDQRRQREIRLKVIDNSIGNEIYTVILSLEIQHIKPVRNSN